MKYKSTALAIAWTLVVLLLYSLPGYTVHYNEPWDLIRLDKLVHFSIFYVLNYLWMKALARSMNWRRWMISLAVISYGALLEGFQSSWFVERTSDLQDFIANSAGVLAALITSLAIGDSQTKRVTRL